MKNLSYVIALWATLVTAIQCRVSRRSTSRFTGTFQGCFQGRTASFAKTESWTNNLNSRCIDYCRGLAHPVAATQGPQCGCRDSLLDLLPRLASNEHNNATGPESQCNRRCLGTPGGGPCHGDTCCGGESAYSVFIVGNIDSVKTILTRAVKALERNNYELLKNLWNIEAEDFTHKPRTDFWGKRNELNVTVTDSAKECWSKCAEHVQCKGATWHHKNRHCISMGVIHYESRKTGCTSYLKGEEKNWENSAGKRLWNHYAKVHLDGQSLPMACRQECLNQRKMCGGASFNIKDSWCYLHRYGNYSITHEDMWYSYEFEKLRFEVQTTATALNSQGEQSDMKQCGATSESGYSCTPTTDVRPTAATTLEVISMERQLVHRLGRNLKPLGSYDFEKDNTDSEQPAEVTKEISITKSDAKNWKTDSGSDISYSLGSKLGVKAGVSGFGVTAEASMEISQQLTVGGFFSEGYSRSKTSTIQETIRVHYTVSPGHKMLINFFKETYPFELKWRSKLLARGKVGVKVYEKLKEFYLLEVLSSPERTVFAFGTIGLGDRGKIVSKAKQINGRGDIHSKNLYLILGLTMCNILYNLTPATLSRVS